MFSEVLGGLYMDVFVIMNGKYVLLRVYILLLDLLKTYRHFHFIS